MAKKKWTPEEREEFLREKAKWDRWSREADEIFARWEARMAAARERRERRRRLLGRFVPFRRAA